MPNKIKSFFWRACKNILPTKVNLRDRRIIHDPTCETYVFATKTVFELAENDFRKCECLVAHGKCIFRKCFSVLTCLWCKLISVFILP